MALELTTHNDVKISVNHMDDRGYATKNVTVRFPSKRTESPGQPTKVEPGQVFDVLLTDGEIDDLVHMLRS